jgi:hypothetical protein
MHAAKIRNEPRRIIFVDSSKSVHFLTTAICGKLKRARSNWCQNATRFGWCQRRQLWLQRSGALTPALKIRYKQTRKSEKTIPETGDQQTHGKQL